MAQPRTATIIRQLGLSQTLAQVADQQAARLGISTPEYIRHLIVQDTQNGLQKEYISPEAEKAYLYDLIEFFASEKGSLSPGATSVEELRHQLEGV